MWRGATTPEAGISTVAGSNSHLLAQLSEGVDGQSRSGPLRRRGARQGPVAIASAVPIAS